MSFFFPPDLGVFVDNSFANSLPGKSKALLFRVWSFEAAAFSTPRMQTLWPCPRLLNPGLHLRGFLKECLRGAELCVRATVVHWVKRLKCLFL